MTSCILNFNERSEILFEASRLALYPLYFMLFNFSKTNETSPDFSSVFVLKNLPVPFHLDLINAKFSKLRFMCSKRVVALRSLLKTIVMCLRSFSNMSIMVTGIKLSVTHNSCSFSSSLLCWQNCNNHKFY